MVSIENVTKSYKNKHVLKGVSLNLESGDMVGVLGENGSGKSTLLSILAGVQKADEGRFFVDDHNLFKEKKLRNEIVAFVPQDTPLIDELNAWDNLRMWYSADRLKKELDSGFLAMLGIDAFIKTPVNQMSGGMKKRLSIGCAINSNPKVLLLDEPTAALDLICKERIYTYFENFRKQGGILMLATHEVQEIELCTSCYILKEGHMQQYAYDGDIPHLIGRL